MNPDLLKLQTYPFEKLARLNAGIEANPKLNAITLGMGEPKHASPEFVIDELKSNLSTLGTYPSTKGIASLRESIANWLTNRFNLRTGLCDPNKHVLPVNGTREALFAIAQTIVDRDTKPLVLMPNPFYQIYEGAAILAGAEPYFLNLEKENNFLPDFSAVTDEVWQRCQLLYICTPGNPSGSVMPAEQLEELINLANKHDFIIVSDECYSEIYQDETKPPVGLLEVAANMGNDHFEHCFVFHSLSKRSNLPGLRSGFVAGNAEIIAKFLTYRTYHGSAMPPAHQLASVVAWSDETHVQKNRQLYRQKFQSVVEILDGVLPVSQPEASFYLWPELPIDDESFARGLYQQQNVLVLPGRYLSRAVHGINPGENRIRMALVAELEECNEAARRIKSYIEQGPG